MLEVSPAWAYIGIGLVVLLGVLLVGSLYLLVRRGREEWREKLQGWLVSDRDKDGLKPIDVLPTDFLRLLQAIMNRNWVGKNSVFRIIKAWIEKLQNLGLRAAFWDHAISLMRLVLLPTKEGREIVAQFLKDAESRATNGVDETKKPLPVSPTS
jgi:hypothetical protein